MLIKITLDTFSCLCQHPHIAPNSIELPSFIHFSLQIIINGKWMEHDKSAQIE